MKRIDLRTALKWGTGASLASLLLGRIWGKEDRARLEAEMSRERHARALAERRASEAERQASDALSRVEAATENEHALRVRAEQAESALVTVQQRLEAAESEL